MNVGANWFLVTNTITRAVVERLGRPLSVACTVNCKKSKYFTTCSLQNCQSFFNKIVFFFKLSFFLHNTHSELINIGVLKRLSKVNGAISGLNEEI